MKIMFDEIKCDILPVFKVNSLDQAPITIQEDGNYLVNDEHLVLSKGDVLTFENNAVMITKSGE